MKLISGKDIQRAIRAVQPIGIAVAYVGADWRTYVNLETLKEIVLSPTMGSNPFAIAEIASALGWENVHFLDNLHSKFYIGIEQAAVGSFNLTSNGLSAEGLEEAGFLIQDNLALGELRSLMNRYKEQADAAYPSTDDKLKRLADLRALWDRAVRNRIIRNDGRSDEIASFNLLSKTDIYVCVVSGDVIYNDDVVVKSLINNSASFLESDDVRPDRWMLCWYARADGLPDARRSPYWMHIDDVLPHGAVEEPYTKLAIERIDRADLSEPFDLSDIVVVALFNVLRSERFPEFLGKFDPWSVTPTLPLLPAFLDALRSEAQGLLTKNEIAGLVDLRQRYHDQ